MKHSFLILALLLNAGLFLTPVFAQKKPTINEEFNKQKEELMKELKDMPPEEAKKIMEMLQMAEKNIKKSGAGNREAKEDTASYFPSQSKLLASIPKKLMSKQELQQYVSAIYADITGKVPAAHKKEIEAIAAGAKKEQLSQVAVIAWYYKKSPVTAVALAAKAGSNNPDDLLALNNLSALMNQGNVPERAIPVLLYLLSKSPQDPMILNNLGQAYAALGDKASAKSYLLRCVKIIPKHPEANNTLAHIAASEGDNASATTYATASLEGGFTMAAANLLHQVEPKDKYESVLSKVSLPDYFNEYKIKLPRLQQLVNEGPAIRASVRAFSEALLDQSDKLYDVYAPLEERGLEQLQAAQAKLLSNPEGLLHFGRTFSSLAKYKLMRAMKNIKADEILFKKPDEDYAAQLKELEKNLKKRQESIRGEYAAKMKGLNCGEGRGADCAKLDKLTKEQCVKLDEAVSIYLKDRAAVTEDYRRTRQNLLLKSFYFNSYWRYLSAENASLAMAAYYKTAQEYIHGLKPFATAYTMDPACGYPKDVTAKAEVSPAWSMECPVDISVSFAVGSLKVNCDEAGFSLGEGAQFSFTQNFKTRQSTFTIGIGASVSKGASIPGVEVKAEAGLSQVLYITYDGINKITDLGMKFGAGVSAGYGFSGSLSGSGDLVTGVGLSKDGGSIKGEVGYTIGINSGFGPHIDFDEGPIKALIGGEKQVNPKVGVYNK